MKELAIKKFRNAVRCINGDAPGQSGGAAKYFLVKVIAPAPDCLGQRQGRHVYGTELPEIDFMFPGVVVTGNYSVDYGAMDGQAALPEHKNT